MSARRWRSPSAPPSRERHEGRNVAPTVARGPRAGRLIPITLTLICSLALIALWARLSSPELSSPQAGLSSGGGAEPLSSARSAVEELETSHEREETPQARAPQEATEPERSHERALSWWVSAPALPKEGFERCVEGSWRLAREGEGLVWWPLEPANTAVSSLELRYEGTKLWLITRLSAQAAPQLGSLLGVETGQEGSKEPLKRTPPAQEGSPEPQLTQALSTHLALTRCVRGEASELTDPLRSKTWSSARWPVAGDEATLGAWFEVETQGRRHRTRGVSRLISREFELRASAPQARRLLRALTLTLLEEGARGVKRRWEGWQLTPQLTSQLTSQLEPRSVEQRSAERSPEREALVWQRADERSPTQWLEAEGARELEAYERERAAQIKRAGRALKEPKAQGKLNSKPKRSKLKRSKPKRSKPKRPKLKRDTPKSPLLKYE